MLDDELCSGLLYGAARELAAASVPDDILEGMRLGRMVALRKPDGRVRGLVMSDVFRRIVARTMAQQLADDLDEACFPHQYALSTRAGTEAVARAMLLATEADPLATVVSIDGIGAYDFVAQQRFFDGLQRKPGLAAATPFVKQFYGQPSTYLWYDQSGACHEVLQAEGGEQGDPLMPGLFALAVHPVLL